ncbi:MAG: GNAT family N-acetyltransferase [Saprospiraceae bacterium]|nr:GNAT family N-acetyltransferase [Saprospiraceae bacterium]
MMNLTVREIENRDIDKIADYWMNASPDFLEGMGVDLQKMPSRQQWQEMLGAQIQEPYESKKSYCMIWEIDGEAVGHCNVNKIVFGTSAYMHLHLWVGGHRQKGIGTQFVKMCIPWFFKNLELKELFCEPYKLNAAPNKTLQNIGFQFVRNYVTVPGWINFEQEVSLWSLPKEKLNSLPSR